jgi:predicted component of type VI protein secretion system
MSGREHRKPQRLRLTVQERELVLDDQRPLINIGRADDNDIVIRGNLISRLHATIELSRGRFTLTDQSTNGTFVQIVGEEESFVRRDSMAIKGEGMIGLGRIPDRDSPLTIYFVCEEC